MIFVAVGTQKFPFNRLLKGIDDLMDQGQLEEEVFAQIGVLRDKNPASDEAQAAVAKLQQCITDNYYTCTKQILRGLGQMYVADERFRQNIDNAGGKGTAAFISRAIEIYCSK